MRGIVAALFLGFATSAGAAGISIGHEELPPRTSMADCLRMARSTMTDAGLTPLRSTSSAAWGENRAGDQLYTIYCIPASGLAVVVGAADNAELVERTVQRLRSLLADGK